MVHLVKMLYILQAKGVGRLVNPPKPGLQSRALYGAVHTLSIANIQSLNSSIVSLLILFLEFLCLCICFCYIIIIFALMVLLDTLLVTTITILRDLTKWLFTQ